jgi:3-phenylpropionate/trans-cinnamate dioxygenase ferredoxin subunit
MEWIKIFSNEQEALQRVPEHKPQLVVIGGLRICLVLHNGHFHAVQDSCTHNGESLSKGLVNFLGEIVCPWHGYRFALDSGRACDSDSRDLLIYPVRIDPSGFYIGIP